MGATLVTVGVIGPYPSISCEVSLEALRKRLNERDSPKVSNENIVQMADFVLKNNFFRISRQGQKTKIWNSY